MPQSITDPSNEVVALHFPPILKSELVSTLVLVACLDPAAVDLIKLPLSGLFQRVGTQRTDRRCIHLPRVQQHRSPLPSLVVY